jgi:hypothetical protein
VTTPTAHSSSAGVPTSKPSPSAQTKTVNPMGTKVVIPQTLSGITSVQVSAWYVNVTDTSQYPNTPSTGHVWDAIDATACAGSKGSSTGVNESDFSVLLSNGSSAGVSVGASGSTFAGPLASLSELGSNLSSLAPGQCDRGWVVFSIPPNVTPQYVQFSGTTASFTQPNSVVKWTVPAT